MYTTKAKMFSEDNKVCTMCRQLQRKRRGCGHSVGEGVSGSAPGQWVPVERWMWTHFQSEPTLFQTLVSGTHMTFGCPPLCKEGRQGDKDRERVCERGRGRWREEYWVRRNLACQRWSSMTLHSACNRWWVRIRTIFFQFWLTHDLRMTYTLIGLPCMNRERNVDWLIRGEEATVEHLIRDTSLQRTFVPTPC